MIILIIAEAYGLPFLSAYLNISKDQDIKKGVNFAFAGATALDVEYYVQNGLPVPDTINSLKVQLGWFKKLKPTPCESKEGLVIINTWLISLWNAWHIFNMADKLYFILL